MFNPGMMLAGVVMVGGGFLAATVGGVQVASPSDNVDDDTSGAVGAGMVGIGAGFVLIGTALAIVGGWQVQQTSSKSGVGIHPMSNGFALNF